MAAGHDLLTLDRYRRHIGNGIGNRGAVDNAHYHKTSHHEPE